MRSKNVNFPSSAAASAAALPAAASPSLCEKAVPRALLWELKMKVVQVGSSCDKAVPRALRWELKNGTALRAGVKFENLKKRNPPPA